MKGICPTVVPQQVVSVTMLVYAILPMIHNNDIFCWQSSPHSDLPAEMLTLLCLSLSLAWLLLVLISR
jgi:hypothetical protein